MEKRGEEIAQAFNKFNGGPGQTSEMRYDFARFQASTHPLTRENVEREHSAAIVKKKVGRSPQMPSPAGPTNEAMGGRVERNPTDGDKMDGDPETDALCRQLNELLKDTQMSNAQRPRTFSSLAPIPTHSVPDKALIPRPLFVRSESQATHEETERQHVPQQNGRSLPVMHTNEGHPPSEAGNVPRVRSSGSTLGADQIRPEDVTEEMLRQARDLYGWPFITRLETKESKERRKRVGHEREGGKEKRGQKGSTT
jgi:hypothetical protein